ncbi:hypothetical protein TBLA_0E05040 [Henningerozyma blattae CBS 6284]|uniref:NADP-dependent oxidoreductase domain-containing protein n=1 Tax=Henningerozyma blattae (strain ATCC 34711 / CBS 6284 / DSM 70876 / NBRC 10599 / NRRL Y-10934 / UCD 77-7) TaxID=1071380 RepID=I2H5A1_HENB6|nr:hypothetical protein TBLA_0E05040 [Tetrapisispora blattae CBS 6284]CCH61553.1 hypothetical protein TBLA_0E05040 [Tetrapisispora blattae CBS 6284]
MSIVQQVPFGKTGLKVSPIIIGCMSYGTKNFFDWVLDDKEEIFGILKHAYDRGLRTYDTADVYSNGMSETILGEFLRTYNIPRETVVIMTKVFFPVDDKMDISSNRTKTEEENLQLINQQHLSRKHILNAVKNSVKRLGTYIDVYQIHRCDHETPFEETMRALNDVVEQGDVRYLGASSMLAVEFAEMQFIAEKHGWHKFVNMQSCYNLVYREDEREMIPFCKRHGIALTPWSPIQKGLLARPLGSHTHRESTDGVLIARKLNQFTESEKEIINRVEKLAIKKNLKMVDISLGWVIQKGTLPILGMSSIERVDEAIKTLTTKLTEDDMYYLEEPYCPRKLIM